MVGRLTMSACAGQRTSGEASGWVWWSISRTDWNHGHGCSHGVGASQPKQQGSTVQLLNIISSPVPLSACGARLEAAAQLEGVARHDVPPVRRTHTCMECAPLKSSAVTLKPRAAARSSAEELSCSNFRPHPVVTLFREAVSGVVSGWQRPELRSCVADFVPGSIMGVVWVYPDY